MLSALRCLCLMFVWMAAAQDDGNPHGWDRKRRCDHTGYSPVCGPCEGIGGIPFGDKNDQIKLTTCEVVSNASAIDPASLIKPVWANRWTSTGYHEVLIGPKSDPFCLNAFPSNSSVGSLCYRKDSGTQIYDMEKAHAIRLDVEVESTLGKIASTVIHQGENMWIVNKLPWYAAGVHQCICTKPRQGGDVAQPVVYPVQYNWTEQMFYIGRERIGVEYGLGTKTLDHWAFGPHHAWSDPSDGRLYRLWQPFNGLQVFPNGTSLGAVNDTLFEDLPPPMCKKGGATFRIKCDDNGMPVVKPKKSEEEAVAAVATVTTGTAGSSLRSSSSAKDMWRAKTTVPRKQYKGDTFAEMSKTLNGWLKRSKTVASTRECRDWTVKELQKLQAMLYVLRHDDLQDIYKSVDDNRKMRTKMDELKTSWDELNSYVHDGDHGDAVVSDEGRKYLHDVLRDGHCHEAVMWYVHHLTEDTKELLAASNVELPLLSYTQHECPEFVGEDAHKAKAVYAAYEEKVTCLSCHANVVPTRS